MLLAACTKHLGRHTHRHNVTPVLGFIRDTGSVRLMTSTSDIWSEGTPNPLAVKFHTGVELLPSDSLFRSVSRDSPLVSQSGLARSLFEVEGIKG